MPNRQLDILAIEPFHGGARRAMLETISRCSRHRWTILKLPPRRLERRLMVAATWFAEHLSRHEVGHVDAIFTSEAMNLADLFRLRPELARRPSVVYFHDNQLPDVAAAGGPQRPTDLVNLNSATAATEVWFNSLYNLRTFLSRASAMVARHRELQNPNPLPGLAAKAHLIPPPIDLGASRVVTGGSHPPAAHPADVKSILIDSRGADAAVLRDVLEMLADRPEAVTVTLIGRPKAATGTGASRPVVLSERDESGHVRALLAADVYVNMRLAPAASDELLIRALAAGAHPVVPSAGVYPEFLPRPMHALCLHGGSADEIVDRILGALFDPVGGDASVDEMLGRHEAIAACRVIDERLNRLAGPREAGHTDGDVPPTIRDRARPLAAV